MKLVRRRVLLSSLFMLALVGAACGGSKDSASDTNENGSVTEAPGQGEADDGGSSKAVTSADGLLTVIPPPGSGPITVDIIEAVGGLGTYELGPDGAQFDEPVLIEFRVTADDLAGGVFGFVESSDGTIEALHLELIFRHRLAQLPDRLLGACI